MDLGELLYDFFARRIVEQGQYGFVEYLVYGAIFLAVAFFIVYPAVHKRGLKFDAKLALASLPYIWLASVFRVLEDMKVLPRSAYPWELPYYFVTPGLYVAFTAIAVVSLVICFFAAKKLNISFYKLFAAIGLIMAVPIALFEIINFVAWPGFLGVIALVLVVGFATIFLLNKFTKLGLMKKGIYKLALLGQLVDGSATFVATTFYRCGEQHPVSGMFINAFPFSFVLVKIALVLLILYFAEKEIKDPNMKGFIAFLLIWLGFGPGLRDLFTIGVGTCL
ncbi:MAG: DUF63 family protein [Candidatus Diapherotrites archaeon]|nr:DUF63 family protein [Candidatus Diapherotrites archaeon]